MASQETLDNDVGTEDIQNSLSNEKRKTIKHKTEESVYFCEQCVFSCPTTSSLKSHKKSAHKSFRYPCDQCEYTTDSTYHLKRHRRKHEVKSYSCDQCEFSCPTKPRLKAHTQSVHNGIRYPCDQCDYTTAKRSYLKRHMVFKHFGFSYPCDLCEFTAIQLSTLKEHKMSTHKFCKQTQSMTEERTEDLTNYEDRESGETSGSSNQVYEEDFIYLFNYYLILRHILSQEYAVAAPAPLTLKS